MLLLSIILIVLFQHYFKTFLNFTPLILIVLLITFILITRVTSEHQRYAMFNIGKYQGLKGPGLVFKWPWVTIYWLRITIGDQGE